MRACTPFQVEDLLRISAVSLCGDGEFSANGSNVKFHLEFYLNYFNKSPEFLLKSEAPNGSITGYIIGCIQDSERGNVMKKCGHITAVAVDKCYRNEKIASSLISEFEKKVQSMGVASVDLYVRVSNKAAINLYKKLGYTVYRTISNYYKGDPSEDAFEMEKLF